MEGHSGVQKDQRHSGANVPKACCMLSACKPFCVCKSACSVHANLLELATAIGLVVPGVLDFKFGYN